MRTNTKRLTCLIRCFGLLFTVVTIMAFSATAEAKKTVPAKLSKKKVSVGKQVSVKTSLKGVKYTSSDTLVASVNSEGVVTAKRPGKVRIKVKCSGYQTAVCKLTVKAASGIPELPVALDEVELRQAKMRKNNDGTFLYYANIRNNAKKGKIRKIEYYYEIQSRTTEMSKAFHGDITKVMKSGAENTDESTVPSSTDVPSETSDPTEGPAATDKPNVSGTPVPSNTPGVSATPAVKTVKKTVVLRASNIKAGKTAKASCEGDISGKVSAMHLTTIKLYAGEALYTYNVNTKRTSLKWGSADKKAPVFSGWVGKKSYYGDDILRVCYSDRKKTYKFKDHVKAVDARDGKVNFTVDTSKIDWQKDGVYKVYYHARDKSGNEATAWAKVQVYVKSTAESIADEVLARITKKGWSQEKKLRAIYQYIPTHCAYVDADNHKNWRNVAVNGFRFQSGDCFTYYSMAKLLITRAGIPNLTVTRYPARPNQHHWWNLVYVRGGWYHFDTTPRQRKGYFCLQTDAQLRMYSTGSTFRFQENKLPKRATKKISRNPI